MLGAAIVITRPGRPKKTYLRHCPTSFQYLSVISIVMLKFRLCLGPSSGRSPVSFITEILYALAVYPPCDFDFSDLWHQTTNMYKRKLNLVQFLVLV